jgi:hypothetical protein
MYEIQVKNIQAVVNEIAELEEYSTVHFLYNGDDHFLTVSNTV